MAAVQTLRPPTASLGGDKDQTQLLTGLIKTHLICAGHGDDFRQLCQVPCPTVVVPTKQHQSAAIQYIQTCTCVEEQLAAVQKQALE